MIRENLQDVLEDDGYAVFTAQDGREALDLIPTLPRATVILLDFRMPRLDGEGVLRDLAEHPNKRDAHPIFLLTANVHQLSPEMVHLLGSQGVPVLPKPFDIERLRQHVRSAFERIERDSA